MRFHLIFKQAIKDFKSKAMLYISFALFTFIVLSIVLGLFAFNYAYSGSINAIFKDIAQPNFFPSRFNFVRKDTKEDSGWDYSNKYVIDENNVLLNYSYSLLTDEYLKLPKSELQPTTMVQEFESLQKYELPKWSSDDVKRLDDSFERMNQNFSSSFSSFFNFLGHASGGVTSENLDWMNQMAGHGHDNNWLYTTKDDVRVMKSPSIDGTNWTDGELNTAAFAKVAKILASPSIHPQFERYLYYKNFLSKYWTEECQKQTNVWGSIPYGIGAKMHADNINPKATFDIGAMPTQEWMIRPGDEKKFSNQSTPNEMVKINIIDQLPKEEIGEDVLNNYNYGYVAPSFFKYNKLKLGDYLEGTYSNHHVKVKIIGTATSRGGYWNNKYNTIIWTPEAYMRSPAIQWWGPGWIDVDYKQAGKNFDKSNALGREDFFKDIDTTKLLGGYPVDVFPYFSKETDWSEKGQQNKEIISLICNALSIIALILFFAVFFYIAKESIVLQKQTLWFLKAMGEKTSTLALMVTINIMVPFLIGAILAIFGSVGVSNMMRAPIEYNYCFYISSFNFTWWSLAILGVVIGLSILIFMIMNICILNSSALTLHGQSKIGWFTKLYIKSKWLYSWWSSPARIGLSFVVQNIGKNVITFILLALSFTATLFGVEFNNTTHYAASTFERENAPYKTVTYNEMNINDNVYWNKDYFKKFPSPNNKTGNSVNDALTDDLKTSKPYDTLVLDNVKDKNIKKELANQGLTKITNANEFKTLWKQQLVEVNKVIGDVWTKNPNLLNNGLTKETFTNLLNEKLNMDNYYLEDNFVKQVLTTNTSDYWANQIVGLNDSEQETMAQFLKDNSMMISKLLAQLLNKPSAQTIIYSLLKVGANGIVKDLNKQMIDGLTKTINQARNQTGEIKKNIKQFNYKMNIFFNKAIVSNSKTETSVFAGNWSYLGKQINAIGLSEKQMNSYTQLLKQNEDILTNKDLKYDKNKKINFSNQEPSVSYLNVNVSQKFGKTYRLKEGDMFVPQINSFVRPNHIPSEPVELYLKINKVIEDSEVYSEIYFDKQDFLQFTSDSVANGWRSNGYRSSQYGTDATNEQKEMNYNSPLYRLLNGDKVYQDNDGLTRVVKRDSNGLFVQDGTYKPGLIQQLEDNPYVLNNSVYSKNKVPFNLSNFSMNAKTGIGYSLFDYINLPFFNYGSTNQSNRFKNSTYIYQKITELGLQSAKQITTTVNYLIVLLLLVTFTVSLILITLIILENRNTILLFKAMGYRKWEVNFYLTSGYIVAAIFAWVIGSILSFLVLKLGAKLWLEATKLEVTFIWSWQFIVIGLGMLIGFIFLVLLTTSLYTNKLKPKDAFSSL
ncbi:ABC transporter permease [Mesoplasma lactucae]|uniref:ABC3 transporter permease C-terminal domain-containing protein n=1 Tax=Mesoplasma lactucae ATCC 49193 TaxID=81460 RepID=A0A291ISN9_9MOLU|nr:ABC transporter permease [Mesoplasma lactucae]ATG97780.1 hypothetical protein CP520_03520 [Mesoplasma lactucae ATCC 49193]ATZ20443.1 hypothetical protein MLACT_v1c06220 [Mesoplasma lactucae ATCC 49193]MCL8216615.1 hypothetical protein [Mesoplasma lactucae ATCC 49193]